MSGTSQNKEKLEDYDGFVEKFKPKKTTDDCYTPETVYSAIADWVAQEYGINKADFVRPFYPGGDYEHFNYTGKIVVDNPPFSILAKIIDFYTENDIKFFLFAPQLTSLKHARKKCSFLCCDCKITYENGAKVNTAFLTNLEPPEICVRVIPGLNAVLEGANKENVKQTKAPPLPKYKYPKEVVSIALLSTFSRYDIPITIKKSEIEWVGGHVLDSQRKDKKRIFGGGFFVSHTVGQRLDRARRQAEEARRQAEEARRQAEEARRQEWTLSPRELEIIRKLEQA
jgi:hypothetical protein